MSDQPEGSEVAAAVPLRWTRVRPGGLAVPTITIHQDHGRMGGGGSGARLITGSDGDRWVMKSPILGGHMHTFFCLNEGLCGLLGRRLGVNVPDVAVVEMTLDQMATYNPTASITNRFAVASQLIEPAEALSPEAAAHAIPAEAAAIVAFDALIINTDRKEEHVLVQRQDDNDRWRLTSIDHGHALAMGNSLAGAIRSDIPAPPPLPLLAQRLDLTQLEPWIEAAAEIRREEIDEMVQVLPGSWVVEPDGPEILSAALFDRAQALGRVLSAQFGSRDTV